MSFLPKRVHPTQGEMKGGRYGGTQGNSVWANAEVPPLGLADRSEGCRGLSAIANGCSNLVNR